MQKSTPIRSLLVLLTLTACSKEVEDSGTSSRSDTSEGSDTAATEEEPCGEDGLCEIIVQNAQVTACEGDTGQTETLTTTATAPGTLEVEHLAAADGCCPDLLVSAELRLRNNMLTANYTFDNDLCDCVCSLDVSYTLTEIPTGSYTLLANGTSQDFAVE